MFAKYGDSGEGKNPNCTSKVSGWNHNLLNAVVDKLCGQVPYTRASAAGQGRTT